MNWKENSRIARFWHKNAEENKIECDLCPRHCKLKHEQMGFCLVRGAVGQSLHTFNYGRAVQATLECMETEAIYHYMPGTKALSMGNIGCSMSCSYCQNWQTSQIKHLNPDNVKNYSPEQVVEIALLNNIEVISWTYNDPVVWHEFVVDTSKLAHKNGIKTLYKSALYIEEEPLNELLDVIDIFSISLKCMNPLIYKKYNKGELEPVLRGIKQIGKSGKHLEISQLIVTGLNDDGTDAIKTARWMLENLSDTVPLHLVAYHPAFRYSQPRTSVESLLNLRKLVFSEGIKHCYIGNVYSENVSNTLCKKCNYLLVERFGLTVNATGLNKNGLCNKCGERSVIINPLASKNKQSISHATHVPVQQFEFIWSEEINSLHVVLEENYNTDIFIMTERFPDGNIEQIPIHKGIERVIFSKNSINEKKILISSNNGAKLRIMPLSDRAHFPVLND